MVADRMTGQCRRGGRAVMGEYVLLSLPHCHLTRPPQASARGPDYVASPFPSLGPSVALSSDQMLPGQGAEGLGNIGFLTPGTHQRAHLLTSSAALSLAIERLWPQLNWAGQAHGPVPLQSQAQFNQ